MAASPNATARQIAQALTNLLKNAAEAIDSRILRSKVLCRREKYMCVWP